MGVGLGYLTFGVVLEQLGRHNSESLFASALVGASAVIKRAMKHRRPLFCRKCRRVGNSYLALEEGTRHSQKYSIDGETIRFGLRFVSEKRSRWRVWRPRVVVGSPRGPVIFPRWLKSVFGKASAGPDS